MCFIIIINYIIKLIFKLIKTILKVFGVRHRICLFVGVNCKIRLFFAVYHVRCKSYASLLTPSISLYFNFI